MFFDVLLIGIMVGAIYLKLMNFAHGDVYIFGTFICYTLLGKYNMNPGLAILLAAVMGGTLWQQSWEVRSLPLLKSLPTAV